MVAFYFIDNCYLANRAVADRGGTVRYSPRRSRQMTEEERTSRIQEGALEIHVACLYLQTFPTYKWRVPGHDSCSHLAAGSSVGCRQV